MVHHNRFAYTYLYLAVSSVHLEEYDQAYARCRNAMAWANREGNNEAKATALRFMSWLRSGGFV